MRKIKEHTVKKWEVSIIEIHEGEEIKFKITRRLPKMHVAETRIIKNKEEAIKLFYEWLE